MTRRVARGTRGWLGRPSAALLVTVVAWWLLIGGAMALTMPAPAFSATPAPFAVEAGRAARIHQPGMPSWPIPIERAAFEEARRAFRESDEAALEHAFSAFEWFDVAHGQAVAIVAVDGEAVQVELLEGRSLGRRGWLKPRHLGP